MKTLLDVGEVGHAVSLRVCMFTHTGSQDSTRACMATVSHRIVPMACFQCGMPLTDRQEGFDALMLAGRTPLEAFEAMELARPCCRANMVTPRDDPRLNRRFIPPQSFVQIHSEPRTTVPYTLSASGATDPLG